jgi:hypothetical protein
MKIVDLRKVVHSSAASMENMFVDDTRKEGHMSTLFCKMHCDGGNREISLH